MTDTQQTLALFSSMEPTTDVEGRRRMDDAREAARPVARRSDPETSHQAAASVAPRAKRDRDRVYEALKAAGEDGLSDFAIGAALGMQQTSCGVRRGELVKVGLVAWSGRHGKSPSGATCRIWVAV